MTSNDDNPLRSGGTEEAADLARAFLVYLTEDADRLGRFLAVTGVGPAEIRARLDDDGFLGGLLDYLLGDEALLVAFCDSAGIDPAQPALLRRRLPGFQPEM